MHIAIYAGPIVMCEFGLTEGGFFGITDGITVWRQHTPDNKPVQGFPQKILFGPAPPALGGVPKVLSSQKICPLATFFVAQSANISNIGLLRTSNLAERSVWLGSDFRGTPPRAPRADRRP